MREIRFRAWDIEGKKMLNWKELNRLDMEGILHLFDVLECPDKWKVVPMQFTGLHDRNGKEIWEDDILKIDGGAGSAFVPVVWSEKEAAFGCIWPEDKNNPERFAELKYYVNMRFVKVEVAGTVHEHPHLLEAPREKEA